MKYRFAVGQRVRILGQCARLLNRGTVRARDDNGYMVVPDGCRKARFGRCTLALVVQGQRTQDRWPRIAP